MKTTQKIRNRFVIIGLLITWTVGGVIGFLGYRQMSVAVRREAAARVENAVRVGKRLIETEFARMDPNNPVPNYVHILSLRLPVEDSALAPLLAIARKEGSSKGFALMRDGLSMVFVRPTKEEGKFRVAVHSLREANSLPDTIRNVVFGPPSERIPSATVTIFENDVRIATNVIMQNGHRANGTRVSKAVAQRVLREGQPWNDRAFVVDRWMITYYEPIRSVDNKVIGMLYAGLDEAPYVKEGERNIFFFLISIFALAGIVSGVAWYSGGREARPLTHLATAAEALGKGKHEKIQVPSTAPEEIQVLARTFNLMADQIQGYTAALKESRDKAQKALADYMEVLGFVAHELKSPISGALTQVMFIEDGYAGQIPEKMTRAVAAIRRYLQYSQEMAFAFNNLSRAESEGFTPKKTWIADLNADLIQSAIADFTDEASHRNLTITSTGDRVGLYADPDLLRVVFDNLIENAVKYANEGTEIKIHSRKTEGALRVEVSNQGVGVPTDQLSQLFTKFFRVQDPQLISRKGTGVGLYLVKRIVEIHGGHVGVESEYGHWIRIIFEVPDEKPGS